MKSIDFLPGQPSFDRFDLDFEAIRQYGCMDEAELLVGLTIAYADVLRPGRNCLDTLRAVNSDMVNEANTASICAETA